MNYTTFATADGEIGGGFNPVSDQNPAGSIFVYIHTDNIEETKAKNFCQRRNDHGTWYRSTWGWHLGLLQRPNR
ncbi:MAG: hypothetical protein HC806_03305 [Anaerolineae bacterium]|nr:hypothetical protein [Anaerolineae bacterium]